MYLYINHSVNVIFIYKIFHIKQNFKYFNYYPMFVSREDVLSIFKILIDERKSNETIYNVYNVSLKCKCSPQRIKTCSLYIPP